MTAKTNRTLEETASTERVRLCTAFRKFLFLTLCGFLFFFVGSQLAYIERGYPALGGEVFFLLTPLIFPIVSSAVSAAYKVIQQNIKESKEG